MQKGNKKGKFKKAFKSKIWRRKIVILKEVNKMKVGVTFAIIASGCFSAVAVNSIWGGLAVIFALFAIIDTIEKKQ